MTIVEENAASAEHSNSVAIVGRVSAPPEERELPSGDRIVTVRLVVSRPEGGAEGFRAQDGERRPRDFSGARPQQPGAGYGKPGGGFATTRQRRWTWTCSSSTKPPWCILK